VRLINAAVYESKEKELPFYVYGRDIHAQVSTLSEDFKERVIRVHGDKFEKEPIMIEVMSLNDVLEPLPEVDFLSIDCEGVDMKVITSNDWNRNRPRLVCVEESMDKTELLDYMTSVGYVFYDRTIGNIFYCKE
jgi:FkbM family methyltransferase